MSDWEVALHCVGIPGSKQENFLFSLPSLLLSDCVKTQHPVIEVTSRMKSWCEQTLSLSYGKVF